MVAPGMVIMVVGRRRVVTVVHETDRIGRYSQISNT